MWERIKSKHYLKSKDLKALGTTVITSIRNDDLYRKCEPHLSEKKILLMINSNQEFG